MIDFLLHILEFLGLLFVVMMVVMMNAGGPGLDVTARGINGLACIWAALKHRTRLFRMVLLEDGNGTEVTVDHGTILKDSAGNEYFARRSYLFLERDWLESMGFRRDNGKVS